MNALRGGIAVLLAELAFWLVPPDHDPKFSAIPMSLQLCVIAFLALMIVGAFVLFLWGVFAEEPWKTKAYSTTSAETSAQGASK